MFVFPSDPPGQFPHGQAVSRGVPGARNVAAADRRPRQPRPVDGRLLGQEVRPGRQRLRQVRASRRANARTAPAACRVGSHLGADGPALDRSVPTVRYWLAKHGLKGKARRGPSPLVSRERVEDAIRDGARTLSADCPHHGRTIFVIENSGRVRCRGCRMEGVTEWRRRTKRRLVAEAGGRCRSAVMTDAWLRSSFTISTPARSRLACHVAAITRSFEELRREAAKCALLCANCHAEVEAGYSQTWSRAKAPPGGLEPPSLD